MKENIDGGNEKDSEAKKIECATQKKKKRKNEKRKKDGEKKRLIMTKTDI